MPKFTTIQSPIVEEQQYSNADYAFANLIIAQIKRQQRLPLMLTPADVFGVLQEYLPYWYEQWPDATQDDQLIFSTDVLQRPQYYLDAAGADKRFRLLTNQVLMPPAVAGVYRLFYTESGYASRSLLNYANWSLEFLLLSSTFGSYPRLQVDQYMGSVFCMNLLDSLSKEPVLHKYNKDSHILQVYDLGARAGSIVCEVARMLPPSTFYENAYFKMFIMAKVIEARADHIELFGAQLPGDLSINIGVLRNRADKLMDIVNKQIEAENNSDFYIIKS